ncbi:hypothetical protein FSP39_014402 [Pinctada imbricata]|uniref:MYND-type domain-containing protein n=1 Tax=Pinctada imbricata TaxID=66713 RepID=A0AA88YIH0_PINIB|nr:hypothetical protein FSP39_014402 [Pinctada imbricata]
MCENEDVAHLRLDRYRNVYVRKRTLDLKIGNSALHLRVQQHMCIQGKALPIFQNFDVLREDIMSTPAMEGVRPAEQKLLDSIVKGSVEELKSLVQDPDVRTDFVDDTGMTPLMHAAFRGREEICELLLAHGADVNADTHQNKYSALMFGALSGNTEVTRILLNAGAKRDVENSVGRNAAQMAGFVGQHQCVSVINNFFPKEELLYFTKIHGLEKEPKLPMELFPSLLKLVNTAALHPVKLSFYLQEHVGLLEEYKKIVKVLEMLCEKGMKAKDTNDVIAMKTHYLATLIRNVGKIYAEKKEVETWIKCLVKGRESDGFAEYQEKFLRQVLREFPYAESELLQQMVRSLANVQIGDSPTAVCTLSQGLNGQRFQEDDCCDTCGEPKAAKKCSACKMVNYCNLRCQKLHWSTHKKFCKKLAEQYKLQEIRRQQEEEKQKEQAAKENMKKAEQSQEQSESIQNESQGKVPHEGEGDSNSTEHTELMNES